MDGVAAAAGGIAVIQAAGALGVVARAFYDAFIEDSKDRSSDATASVEIIVTFLDKIETFQLTVKAFPPLPAAQSNTTGPSSVIAEAGTTHFAAGDAVSQLGLDHSLKLCEELLQNLRMKVQKMKVMEGAKLPQYFIQLFKPETAQSEAIITTLLTQLNVFVSMAASHVEKFQ